MKYIIVYDEERCFFADSEKEILEGLEEKGWSLYDCQVFERGIDIEFEIKIVPKPVATLTRKGK